MSYSEYVCFVYLPWYSLLSLYRTVPLHRIQYLVWSRLLCNMLIFDVKHILVWTSLFWNPGYFATSEWNLDRTNYKHSKIVWIPPSIKTNQTTNIPLFWIPLWSYLETKTPWSSPFRTTYNICMHTIHGWQKWQSTSRTCCHSIRSIKFRSCLLAAANAATIGEAEKRDICSSQYQQTSGQVLDNEEGDVLCAFYRTGLLIVLQ
jgi:hypothetical protein